MHRFCLRTSQLPTNWTRVSSARRFLAISATAATADAAASVLPRVVLKGGKTRLFTENQSPTVYGGAIDRVLGRPTPRAGDPVLVCNGKEEPFAWGVFNPTSMYRVRILQTLDDVDAAALVQPDLEALVSDRIKAAVSLRAAVGLPSADTTTIYRLINSEGDRLSGLVVDVLGETAVVQASAAWVQQRQALIESLIIEHAGGVKEVVWRQAAELTAEEGWVNESEEESEEKEESKEIEEIEESKSVVEVSVAVEAGLKYFVDPFGQKTGFYCDQRDHRAFIRGIAAGKEVLDVCCYSGGFALNALEGGAVSAVGVDSSASALELGRKNAEVNGMTEKCSFEKADAAEYMKRVGKEGKQWDIVVLDPPKLAPSRKALTGAMRKYEALNAAAMRLVRPGGVLMTCSCSGAVAQSGEFVSMLQKAAKRARRRVSVVRMGGASPDHPLDPGYPEGSYLTNVTVIVS